MSRLVSKFIIFWNSFRYLCELSFLFHFFFTFEKFDAVQRYNKIQPISITKCLLHTHNIIVQFRSEIIQINTQLSRANISTCQQHIYLLACFCFGLNHRDKNDDKKETKLQCWKAYNAGHNQIEMIIDILIWVILSNLIVKCMMGMNVLYILQCWKIVLFCKLNIWKMFFFFVCFHQFFTLANN